MRCCSYNYGLLVLVMFENFAKLYTRFGYSSNFGKTLLKTIVPNCTRHRIVVFLAVQVALGSLHIPELG